MCPSYMVTREEEHSTRGRSRLLFEMLEGHADSPVTAGWRSTEVRDALDLCLACKGCKKDCPVEVDMATMKAEFLAHHYAGRLRPRSHYSMGWLPAVAQAASRAPRVVNALTQAPVLRDALTAAGGIDRRRRIPLFADQTFQAWAAGRDPGLSGREKTERGEVVLWPDTFTNHLTPSIGQAAVEVLEAAGWRVIVPQQPMCCGLTWISTGQLVTARRVLRRTVHALAPYLQRGALVVGLEPSCTAVFRSDARELMPGDRDVQRLRQQTVTLAELLTDHTDGWQPPHLGGQAIAQTHCHQHAIMGYDPDQALLRAAGVDLDVLDAGCCGLAGNFGFEAGHYDVSRACGERVLLPAVRDAAPATLVLADGFSCRTQIEQAGTGRTPVHLAEVLAAGLRGQSVQPSRPAAPRASDYARLAAIAAAVAGLGTALGALARRRRHRGLRPSVAEDFSATYLTSASPRPSRPLLPAPGAPLQLFDSLGRVSFCQRLGRLLTRLLRKGVQVGPLRSRLRFAAGLPVVGILDHRIVVVHAFELPGFRPNDIPGLGPARGIGRDCGLAG